MRQSMNDESKAQPQKHAGVFVPPPLVYVAIFIAAMLLNRGKPFAFVATPSTRAIGIALIVLAAALAVWSIGLFWRAGTSIVPIKASTAFVATGPYRFSRNPMYVSLLIAYTGAGFLSASFWPFLLLPVVIAVVGFVVIRPEERYMSERFGDAYAIYRSRVRRWI